jgi:hypothetical protein
MQLNRAKLKCLVPRRAGTPRARRRARPVGLPPYCAVHARRGRLPSPGLSEVPRGPVHSTFGPGPVPRAAPACAGWPHRHRPFARRAAYETALASHLHRRCPCRGPPRNDAHDPLAKTRLPIKVCRSPLARPRVCRRPPLEPPR